VEFDFAQNTKVADINKIPNDFRGLYKQDGETFVLDSENGGVKSAISAITGLNQALRAARAEVKNKVAGPDMTPLKEFGATPEEIANKFKETVTGLQEQIKGVNVGKIKEDLATEWTGKLTAEQKKAQLLEQHLYNELVESRATAAIAGEKGDVELLLPFVRKSIKASVTSDGKYNVQVVDAAGDVRYSGVTGSPMSIKELVTEMKGNDKYGKLFSSEAPSGSGTTPGATSRKPAATNPARDRAEMSPTEKIAAGLKKGGATRGK
jgi:hypothetical protein